LRAACGPCVKSRGANELGFIISLLIEILGIVGLFIDIPIISQYAFWVVVAAYVVLAGTRA
jgi:hypothetical protein